VATSQIIRPSAVLGEVTARRVLAWMNANDVNDGGLWNATPSLWQRYDKPWDGRGGDRGSAELVGSIAVVYGQPGAYDITIYKVTLSRAGVQRGWTVESLCDAALGCVDLTLDTVPRAQLLDPPARDPFHVRRAAD
jgi:hypothetical protein